MKLVCPECRRENEPERIYCHDCGARLDRSALAKEKPKEEDPKDTQRRLNSILNPPGAKLRYQLLQGTKLIVGAIVVASLVQMFRVPDLPEPSKEANELPRQINLELEDATMVPAGGPSLRYTQAQVNDYLVYKLKSKQKNLSSYLSFNRAVARFEEGRAYATVERSLLGYSIFTTIGFVPGIENEHVTARIVSGRIGRLPVHPAIMQVAGFLFSDVAAVLDRDRRSIAKLGTVEVHPEAISLIPKQPAR